MNEAMQFTGEDSIQELSNFCGAESYHMFYVEDEKTGLCLNLANKTHILIEPGQWVSKTDKSDKNPIGFDVNAEKPA